MAYHSGENAVGDLIVNEVERGTTWARTGNRKEHAAGCQCCSNRRSKGRHHLACTAVWKLMPSAALGCTTFLLVTAVSSAGRRGKPWLSSTNYDWFHTQSGIDG